jgi:hypothetical protein
MPRAWGSRSTLLAAATRRAWAATRRASPPAGRAHLTEVLQRLEALAGDTSAQSQEMTRLRSAEHPRQRTRTGAMSGFATARHEYFLRPADGRLRPSAVRMSHG